MDTLAYNAHSTACDVLRSGLLLLTCTGTAFAGRAATSVLHAIGVSELATGSPAEYEALAPRLAAEPSLLNSFRKRLVQNRSSCSLLDSSRLCHHFESAYAAMWKILKRGEGPQSFEVDHCSMPK